MAEALGILGQVIPADTNLAEAYAVPSLTQATISSITVCNQTASPSTFRISVANNGELDTPKQYLFYDQPLDAYSSFIITIGITLTSGDKIRVRSGNANALSFNVFGIEVS
jgi:hypothetical protein